MTSLRDLSHQARQFVPLPVLLKIGRRRVAKRWEDPEFRAAAEANMRFVLEFTDRADEIPQLAREYAEFDALRNYRRWRPKQLLRQRVEGIEWLTTKKDPNRGVVLSFVHHGQYDGLVASLAHAGAYVRGVVAPEAFDPNTPLQLRRHYQLCGIVPEAPLLSTAVGSKGMIETLNNGEILVIASDVAGRTPLTFLGRQITGSFGAARFAVEANAPVVLLTSHQEPDGSPFFRIHPPFEPSEFDGPAEVLAEMMRRHEPAVLEWPAAFDSPLGRLAIPATA